MQIGELWALPSLLRFVLIENLRRLALRVNRSRELRSIANSVADVVLASGGDDNSTQILTGYTDHARDTAFATQLLYRLRDGSQNAGRALIWLETELEKSGSDAEEIIIAEHRTLSSGNVTTGNIIRGLRKINDIDWTEWFEAISRVDALLRERTDFAALDFSSRDQYRTAIEDLARRSNLSEYYVADRALQLAGADAPEGRAPPSRRRTSAFGWSARSASSSRMRSATGRASAAASCARSKGPAGPASPSPWRCLPRSTSG